MKRFEQDLYYRNLGVNHVHYHSSKPAGFKKATGDIVEILGETERWQRANNDTSNRELLAYSLPPTDAIAKLKMHLEAMRPYFDGFVTHANVFDESEMAEATRRGITPLEYAAERGFRDDVYLLKQYKGMLDLLPQLETHPFITDSLGKLESIKARLQQKVAMDEQVAAAAVPGNVLRNGSHLDAYLRTSRADRSPAS